MRLRVLNYLDVGILRCLPCVRKCVRLRAVMRALVQRWCRVYTDCADHAADDGVCYHRVLSTCVCVVLCQRASWNAAMR